MSEAQFPVSRVYFTGDRFPTDSDKAWSSVKKTVLQETSPVREWWWQRDDDSMSDRKKKKSWSRSSRGSVDWWLDRFSGEIRANRRNGRDWASGEILKVVVLAVLRVRGVLYATLLQSMGAVGSSLRNVMVHSYGVFILVLISGRRPLQVTASPLSEFEHASLISWPRHLAHSGKLQDLFDPAIQSLDREQALLCVTVALLFLHHHLPEGLPLKKL